VLLPATYVNAIGCFDQQIPDHQSAKLIQPAPTRRRSRSGRPNILPMPFDVPGARTSARHARPHTAYVTSGRRGEHTVQANQRS